MSKRNEELAHRWFEEVWNQARVEAIEEMASPDAVGEGQAHHSRRSICSSSASS